MSQSKRKKNSDRVKVEVEIEAPNVLEYKNNKKLVISVFANKGGVGKTTLTLNIANVISKENPNLRILIVDMDTQMNSTCFYLAGKNLEHGVDDFDRHVESSYEFNQQPTTVDFVNRDHSRLDHCLQSELENKLTDRKFTPMRIREDSHLYLLKGSIDNILPGVENEFRLNRPQQSIPALARIIKRFKLFDITFLDLNPALDDNNRTIIRLSDAILMPTLPDLYSKIGFKMIKKKIYSDDQHNLVGSPPKFLGFVLNKCGIKSGNIISDLDGFRQSFVNESKMINNNSESLGFLEELGKFSAESQFSSTPLCDLVTSNKEKYAEVIRELRSIVFKFLMKLSTV